MITTALKLFACLCLVSSAMAEQASVESIKELLVVTEAKKLVDGMFPQVETSIKSSLLDAIKNFPEEKRLESEKAISKVTGKIFQAFQEEMAWEKLEPVFLGIYQKSYTQEEVDGMLSFYKSPTGVAVVKKMPLVTQETMVAVQQHMVSMMGRIQNIAEEVARELEK